MSAMLEWLGALVVCFVALWLAAQVGFVLEDRVLRWQERRRVDRARWINTGRPQ